MPGSLFFSSLRRCIAAGLCLLGLTHAVAADTFDGQTLTIPSVSVSGTYYSNVKITVGRILSVSGGSATTSYDTFDPAAGILYISSVQVGNATYNNVEIMPGTILAVGGVAGPLTLSSLGVSSAAPFSSITLTGHGFDPANAALSVLFIPENGAPAMVIPAYSATATTLQVIVPPVLNPTSGMLGAGMLDVSVVQVDGGIASLSNTLKGLSVTALPSVATGLHSGAVTAAFLTTSVNLATLLQGIATTHSGWQTFQADLSTHIQNLDALISSINAIVANPAQSVSLSTSNGENFTLDATLLAQSDALVLAYGTQLLAFNASVPVAQSASTSTRHATSLAQTSANCGLNTGDPGYDQFICSMQTSAENQAIAGAKAVQMGAQFEAGFYLGALGGWAIDGLSAAEVIVSGTAAQAYQLLWSGASSYIASYAVSATSPTLSDSLTHSLTEITDKAVLGGLGILPAALDAGNLYKDATAIMNSSGGVAAPEGGIVLAQGQQNTPQGSTGVTSYSPTGSIQIALSSANPVVAISDVSITACTNGATDFPVCTPPAGANYCKICSFNVYCTTFGFGGCWTCQNSTYSAAGICQGSQPYGSIVSPGHCVTDPSIYTICN